MIGPRDVDRRAGRLVRLYPAPWRERYGEEFHQYLVDDMIERPFSPARTADVLRAGMLARVEHAGLAGDVGDPVLALRAGLGGLGLAAAVFFAAGIAVWSQLTVSWQWSAPAGTATRSGMLLMSMMLLILVALSAAAAAPLVWALLWQLRGGRRRTLIAPLAVMAAGAAVLSVGAVHFGHGWPGTGGHAWSGRGLVPGPVGRITWAATLWITSYWAHPGSLSRFPASEVAWMIASPLALVALLAGAWRLLRRLELSARVLAYESWAGVVLAGVMAAFLAGAASWVVTDTPASHGLYRVGVIDAIAVAGMALSLVVAWRLGRQNLGLGRRLASGPPVA